MKIRVLNKSSWSLSLAPRVRGTLGGGCERSTSSPDEFSLWQGHSQGPTSVLTVKVRRNGGHDLALAFPSQGASQWFEAESWGAQSHPAKREFSEETERSPLVELLKSFSSAWKDSIKRRCRKTSQPRKAQGHVRKALKSC